MNIKSITIFVVTCIITIFLLAGCGDAQNQNKEDSQATNTSNTVKLDIETIKTDSGSASFNISIEDFIKSFNSYYEKDKGEVLLKDLGKWQMYDVTLDNQGNNVTTCYSFSEDINIRALPQLKVYADNTKSGILQISMCYDMHSFSPETHAMYKELCYYAMKTMMPDASDDKVKERAQKALDSLDESFTTDETSYDYEPVFTWGPIGAYPYYVVGETMELRLIPVANQ